MDYIQSCGSTAWDGFGSCDMSMTFDEGFSVVLEGELVFRPPLSSLSLLPKGEVGKGGDLISCSSELDFEEEEEGCNGCLEEERVEFGVGEQVFVNAAMPYTKEEGSSSDDDDDDGGGGGGTGAKGCKTMLDGLVKEGATGDTIALVRKIWEGVPSSLVSTQQHQQQQQRLEDDDDTDSNTYNNDSNNKNTNEEEEEKEMDDPIDQVRHKKIQLLVRFFEHAATCDSASCPSLQCIKMKKLFRHSQRCKIKKNGGCDRCETVRHLSSHHAQNCKSKTCPIPLCVSLRQPIQITSLISQLEEEGTDDVTISEIPKCYEEASATTTTETTPSSMDNPAITAISDTIKSQGKNARSSER